MQKLPKNPFALGVIYAFVFASLTIVINALILHFFDLYNMTFVTWMVYKLIYTTVLSIKIVEFCIFRYVQPDWAKAKCAPAPAAISGIERPVRNPMPRVGVFKEMYGCITGILVTNGYLKSMKATILTSGPALLEQATADRRFTWMPKKKGALMCLITLSVMLFSVVALPAVMHLFGKSFLNFYQFVIFITVYAALISKPLSYILVKRCMQPDYIRKTFSEQ